MFTVFKQISKTLRSKFQRWFMVESPCAYRVDIAWYLLVLPARLLGRLIYGPPTATPLTVALSYVFLTTLPILIYTAFNSLFFGRPDAFLNWLREYRTVESNCIGATYKFFEWIRALPSEIREDPTVIPDLFTKWSNEGNQCVIEGVNFLNDYVNYFNLLIELVIVFMFFYLVVRVFRPYAQVKESGVLECSLEDHNRFISKLEKRFNSKVAIGICFTLTIVELYFTNLRNEYIAPEWWGSLPPYLLLYNWVWIFLTHFAIFSFTWKVTVFCITIYHISINTNRNPRATNNAYKYTLKAVFLGIFKRISPVNEGITWKPQYSSKDNSSGFGKLASFWFRVYLLIIMVGTYIYTLIIFTLALGTGSSNVTVSLAIIMIAGVIIGTVFLFLPFYSIHTVMRNHKNEEVALSRKRLYGLLVSREQSLWHTDAEHLELQSADIALNTNKQIPTLPFSTRLIEAILITFGANLVFFILSLLILNN